MAAIDDIEIPSLLLAEQGTAPTTPATGFGRLYAKSTGLFFRGDDGVEIGPLGSAGGGTITSTRVYRSSALSLASGGSGTAISFDAEDYDDGNWHDLVTNPSRITVPSNGLYLLQGALQLAANATGERQAQIHVDGTYRATNRRPGSTVGSAMQVQTTLRLSASSYVELLGYQTSGSSLAYTTGTAETWLAVTRLGD